MDLFFNRFSLVKDSSRHTFSDPFTVVTVSLAGLPAFKHLSRAHRAFLACSTPAISEWYIWIKDSAVFGTSSHSRESRENVLCYTRDNPKILTNRVLLELWCTGSITPWAWKGYLWPFLTKIKQDQAPQVMCMVKFSHTAVGRGRFP